MKKLAVLLALAPAFGSALAVSACHSTSASPQGEAVPAGPAPTELEASAEPAIEPSAKSAGAPSTSSGGATAVPEATSLLGRALYPYPIGTQAREVAEKNLAEAQAAFDADPSAEASFVWLGRRLAYLGRFKEAVDVYTRGLALHPRSYRLLRHRGHRWITLREFERAEADLERAAELLRGLPEEIDPPGDPDPAAAHPSTVQHAVHYHLALARYLARDFEGALEAWRDCMRVSRSNPDMLCGASHWTYMTLRRLGRVPEAEELLAPIRADLDVRESKAYHRMLLMYKGEIAPEELIAPDAKPLDNATLGYGLANWYLYNGRAERGLDLMRELVDTPVWPAFGCIASEAELAALKR